MQAHKTGGEGDELVDHSFRDGAAGVLGHRDVKNNFSREAQKFFIGEICFDAADRENSELKQWKSLINIATSVFCLLNWQ